jgi:hypothetical protein
MSLFMYLISRVSCEGGTCLELPGVTQAQCNSGICDLDPTVFDEPTVCYFALLIAFPSRFFFFFCDIPLVRC